MFQCFWYKKFWNDEVNIENFLLEFIVASLFNLTLQIFLFSTNFHARIPSVLEDFHLLQIRCCATVKIATLLLLSKFTHAHSTIVRWKLFLTFFCRVLWEGKLHSKEFSLKTLLFCGKLLIYISFQFSCISTFSLFSLLLSFNLNSKLETTFSFLIPQNSLFVCSFCWKLKRRKTFYPFVLAVAGEKRKILKTSPEWIFSFFRYYRLFVTVWNFPFSLT